MSRIKSLWVREPYLKMILDGRKTIEVRVAYDNIRRLEPGDQLRLNAKSPGEALDPEKRWDPERASGRAGRQALESQAGKPLVTIKRISHYRDFEEMLTFEDAAAIDPDHVGKGDSDRRSGSDDLLLSLRRIYPAEKEALGVVALELSVPRRYDAVFLDMGYTLINFEPTQEVIVQEALATIKAARSVEEIHAAARDVWGEYFRDAETIGFPATREHDEETQDVLNRRLLERLDVQVDEDTLRLFSESVEAWFRRPGVMRPYPEVVDVLGALQERGYRLGIISNWSWNLGERVAQVGLEDYFEVIWASAYAGYNKPHPSIFYQALDKLPPPTVQANRVLYVGDSYRHDVVGARNAGLDVVLLDREGTSDAEDCTVIRDLGELLDVLRG
ncbi:HAD-IA family hydrolase [Chloroflexota bacterium]